MKQVEKIYRGVPFWSWNDTLDKDELVRQVEWMNDNGIGGFFMHARGGLKTEYLGEHWHECVEACAKRAQELGMEAYAYDENGWPSGFAGGKLLEDIENHDRYLTYKYGAYDKDALASFALGKRALKKAKAGDTDCLNVYEHYSTSTADILNGEVMDKFIEITHEEYKKRDKYGIKGFFTDEPQYYRWNMPYTKVLPAYFQEKYGESIFDRLGLLFVEKQGYRDFRYKYWRAMQELMLENYAKKIYDWCDKYGYKLTGHYIEEAYLAGQMNCCAGIMPFYEYEHIPGIDYLGTRITEELGAKQVSSVAEQLGKKQVMTETFAACGWDVSPLELKMVAESQYVAGVNLMCHHLLPYHEQGQRKRDYPSHFSSVNPWIDKGFKDFNDYFSYLGKLIANSEEIINVGVLHPVRSAYFDYKTDCHAPYNGLGFLERPFFALMTELCNKGVGHHYLDEVLLAKYGRVEGQSLILGKCKYDYIILPYMLTMDKTTEKLLREYVENGGKVLLWGKKPQYLEGKKYSYKYLKSNTSLREIMKNQPYSIVQAKGGDIRAAYRRDEEGRDFIYAVNLGEDATATFKVDGAKSFNSYDIFTDTYKNISKRVHFARGQSYLLYLDSKAPRSKKALKSLTLKGDFAIKNKVDNYLTLDMIRYSLDGKTFSEPRHHMCVLDELLHLNYKGHVWLKYEVNIHTCPTKCSVLAENTNTVSMSVNGQSAENKGGSPLDLASLYYDVADKLKIGKNEIVMEIDYCQGENVHYAIFGENVTESLKNCLAYDTDIEAIYLCGDFGVYAESWDDSDPNRPKGENFYVGEQPTSVTELIKGGFPFFRGHITLTQKVELNDTGYELFVPEHFHIIDATVNGKAAGRMMFSKRLDIKKYLKKGENEIELTLTVGNRNLLGPFHTDHEGFIGPDTFERFGTWKDGKSPRFFEKYAFLKSII